MGISPRQFAELEARAAGRARPRASAPPAVVPAVRRILGLDPSLRGSGWGILELTPAGPRVLAHGTIHCPPTWERTRCLGVIGRTLREVIATHQPAVCAVEGLFFAQNLKTAIIMGEARGAALAAIAEALLPVYELATRKVKLAIVGHGGAQKLAVARMVQRLTGLAELPEPDAADALAVALAYAQEAGRPAARPPARI